MLQGPALQTEVNGCIYALLNEAGEVFYVGATTNEPARRTRHRARFGRNIKLAVIQSSVPKAIMGVTEAFWIRYYKTQGAQLQNVYARNGLAKRSEEASTSSAATAKTVMDFFREAGSAGGKKSAGNMTDEQRSDRAKKAAAQSAEVRTKKAAAKKAPKEIQNHQSLSDLS